MQEEVVERRKDAGLELQGSKFRSARITRYSLLPEELEPIRRHDTFVSNIQPDDVQRVKLNLKSLRISKPI